MIIFSFLYFLGVGSIFLLSSHIVVIIYPKIIICDFFYQSYIRIRYNFRSDIKSSLLTLLCNIARLF